MGIIWEGATFVDCCLPFGLRSTPKIFSAVADALAFVFGCYGLILQVHYLDDFLFLEPPCRTSSSVIPLVSSVCSSLGVPLASNKTEGPATCLTFLGISVNSSRWELRLPDDKMELIYALIQVWSHRSSCHRRELESFLGHFSHAATIIRQGCPFLHDLFQLLSVARQLHYFVRLTRGAKADILWWLCFLQRWNGRSFFPQSTPSVHIYTDAAGSIGCGGFQVKGHWFQLVWPGEVRRSIAALELIPVVIAAIYWGCNWRSSMVCFHSDNEAVVKVLSKGSSKDSSLSHLMWCLALLAAFYGFHISAVHVPVSLNEAADALSQNNLFIPLSLPTGSPGILYSSPCGSAASNTDTGLGLNYLDRAVQRLFRQRIASSTVSSYLTGWRCYISLCTQYWLHPLPLIKSSLCRFVAFLCARSLSPQTVSVYLNACRISSGLPDPLLSSFTQLSYVLKGMRRFSPRAKRVRLPITPEILGAIWDKWSVDPASFNRTLLWAAFCLAFFAFLRAGEFTCPSWAGFDDSVMLSLVDIAVDSHSNPSHLSVWLKRSKCDPFAQGITLYVGRSYSKLCAVSAVLSYLAVCPQVPSPLFFFQDGSVLSRHRLVSELSNALLSIGLDPSPYRGHSFRIGAATAAARAGFSESLIQTLGRWKSSAFQSYIRTSREQICSVAPHLVR